METNSSYFNGSTGMWSPAVTSEVLPMSDGIYTSDAVSTLRRVITSDGISTAASTTENFISTMMHMSTETPSITSQNVTLADNGNATGSDWVTTASGVVRKVTTTYKPHYEYSTAQFEVLLPCIFGMFVILALSFIVFYSKHTNQYEVLEKRPSEKNKPTPTEDWSTSHGMGEMNDAFSFGS